MLTHFSISQQGQRHAEKEIPCQDFSCSLRIRKNDIDIILCGVADGVGSCEFSQYGSKIAVKSIITYLENAINNEELEFNDEKIFEIMRKGFNNALENIENIANERELPFLEYDTTLTAAIYDGENLWFGHIGDDGIVALYNDGTYEMITERHKGEEVNSLFPLRNSEFWQFGKAPKNVASFALMTDGVLDFCVDIEAMKNRVYFPFIGPVLTEILDTDEKAIEEKKLWDEYFSKSIEFPESIRTKIIDDISLVVVENSDSVKNLPNIEFDYDKWEKDTEKRKKELDEKLYSKYRIYKEKLIKQKELLRKMIKK